MGSIRLQPVSLSDLSGLHHEVFISSEPRTLIPKFLVIRYSGKYRSGAEGRGDALYIVATAEAARKAWYAPSTVLDFRELGYDWGDEMEWITSIGWNPVIGCREPLAVVVGDGCRRALKTLLSEDYEGCCVEDMEEAYSLCRRLRLEYEQRLKERRDRA
jgi:hypothetical protein